jgi:hypothetical protein
LPSGDQDGDESLELREEATYRTDRSEGVKMAIDGRPLRPDSKASRDPSGDHVSAELVPSSAIGPAGADPSSGAMKMRPSLTNATLPVRGATTGASPSPSSRGAPPAAAIDHTCIFG